MRREVVIRANEERPAIKCTANYFTLVEENVEIVTVEEDENKKGIFEYTDVFNDGKVKLFIPKAAANAQQDENLTEFT